MEKQSGGSAWRLVGARPRGTLCHKPCTVSGGGKSEISKSIGNVILEGPVFVGDFQHDVEHVAEILKMDFSAIYKDGRTDQRTQRSILGPERTMGSVIHLFTPSPEYTDEHNDWLSTLPYTLRELLVHGEALLPSGMGRQLARAFCCGSRQRIPGARAEVREPEAGRTITCAWATIRMAPGAFTSCVRIFIPRTRCRWRTTSPLRWCCRARV